MLSVNLVRSLILNQPPHHDHNHDHDHDHDHHPTNKKMPMLLFTVTNELISDTFRLSTIASLLGMNSHPSPTLSHLLFSWPTPTSTISNSNTSFITPNIPRFSVSSQTSTSTATSSSSSSLPLDTAPIPFPTLSTTSSISLLRAFVSLSKGYFKLVFLDDPNPDYVNCYHALLNYDPPVELDLYSRVTGKRVKLMDELGKELMGKGWSMFRSNGDLVYLFRKTVGNRVRVRVGGGGDEGGCRVKELRLSRVEFEKGVNLRVLLYILLVTHDVFYLA